MQPPDDIVMGFPFPNVAQVSVTVILSAEAHGLTGTDIHASHAEGAARFVPDRFERIEPYDLLRTVLGAHLAARARARDGEIRGIGETEIPFPVFRVRSGCIEPSEIPLLPRRYPPRYPEDAIMIPGFIG